jgi:mono/diheme cytochrome c family protein
MFGERADGESHVGNEGAHDGLEKGDGKMTPWRLTMRWRRFTIPAWIGKAAGALANRGSGVVLHDIWGAPLRWFAGPKGFVVLLAATLLPPVVRAQAPATPAEVTSFDRAKAESLLRDQLPCLGCHTLVGKGGKLAPELATVRSRRDPAYIARMVADPQATVQATPMPHTPMPHEWRVLIVRYLGGDAAVLATTSAGQKIGSSGAADSAGSPLYARYCTGCHGTQGRGDGPNAASLPVPPARHASKEAMSTRSDDALYDTIAGGGAIMNRSPRMPAYGTTLSPVQIRALVRHIRSLCGCQGPSWSTDGQGTAK